MAKSKFTFSIVLLTSILLFTACTSQPKQDSRPSAVVHPEWSKSSVIYEVNIRQYTPEGTFKAFEQHLPRLKEMGVDILWLMPIHPIGVEKRKGSLGSYYSIKDYMGVNPEFGTMDDFKALVKRIHELGMKVIIDWVPNHTSWDNPLITQHPDWYKTDSSGNIVPPVKDWTDVAHLNFDKPGLREYMTNAMEFWVREADIDGYRCDVAGMIPMGFWNSAVPELKKSKPLFMLAENEGPDMHDTAFDMTYSWDIHHLMNKIYKGEKTALGFDTLFAKEMAAYSPDAYRMRFTSNHDENSWAGTEFERLGEAAQTFAALTFVMPGMPLIYSGQESAFDQRIKFFDKDTIEWGNYSYASFYTTLIQLKKENPALWNGLAGGTLEKVSTNSDQAIYAFTREKEGNRVFSVFNLSNQPQAVTLKKGNLKGNYKNVFSGEEETLDSEVSFEMRAWEYRIYSEVVR
jgi:glycosidase